MNQQNRLVDGRMVLLDGGTASELKRRGAAIDSLSWGAESNLTAQDLLRSIHRDYIDAGAEIVTANTFAASRFVLNAAGLGAQFNRINTNAVDAVRRACKDRGSDAIVAASISCLPPGFDRLAYPAATSEAAAYAEQAKLYADLGVDLILLEMMQDEEHASRAAEAAATSGLPFWLGISCRLAADGRSLTSFDGLGVELDEVLERLLGFGPSAVTVMHSPIDAILPTIARIREHWSGPVGAYAELPYAEDDDSAPIETASAASRSLELMAPPIYAGEARRWIEAGSRIVGGCCGTTPAHIRALRKCIDAA